MSRHWRLYSLMILLLAGLGSTDLRAQDGEPDDMAAMFEGRWQGVIRGPLRDQAVSWRFELDAAGVLTGFMGPTDSGYPQVAMDNLYLNAGTLRFSIANQNAEFEGEFDGTTVSGFWLQGLKAPVSMRKQDFAWILPGALAESLAGEWQTRVSGSRVDLTFTPYGPGTVIGRLSIPAAGFRQLPLVELITGEEGYLQFATDNNRSFSGRLVNGVILGRYTVNGVSYNVLFEQPGVERFYALDLGESEFERLEGVWRGSVLGTRVSVRVEQAAAPDGSEAVVGFMDIAGVGSNIPLLEVVLQGGGLTFTSNNGRYFAGQFVGDSLSGTYNNNGSSYSASFTRQPQ